MSDKKTKWIKADTKPQVNLKETGFIPPQKLDVEEVVLGCIILEGNNTPDKIMIDIKPDLFYKPQYKVIAESIIQMYSKGEAIDMLTIIDHLKKRNSLDEAGGVFFISSLTNKVASSSNLEFYVKILQQESLKRNLMEVSYTSIRECLDETQDVFDVYAKAQSSLEMSIREIMHYEVRKVNAIHGSIIKESINILETGKKSGVISGLNNVDKITSGWQDSDLIIVAGRPGMGKTAVAVSMIMNPAIQEKIPVALFSLEMSAEQVVGRMQSGLTGINVGKIIKKQLDKGEIQILAQDASVLENAPIFIDDTPSISLIELKGKCRKMVREHGVRLIVIDYLQLMRSGLNIQNREQEVAEISRGLKALAKELKVPVIALSQLSRTVESTSDKKPLLQHLRESGSIEQDADMVVFCYRPEYYEIKEYQIGNEVMNTDGLFMFIIAKHRNGELGEIRLKFIGNLTKVTNYEDAPYSASAGLTPNPEFSSLIKINKSEEDLPF